MLLRLTVLLFTSLLSLTAKANLITYDFVGSIDSYTNYALSDYPDLQGETLSFSVTFLDEDVTGNHEYGLDAISDHQIGEYLFQTPNEGTAIGSYNGRVWMYILPFTTTFVYKDGVKVDTLKLDGGIGFNDDGTNGYWNYNLLSDYEVLASFTGSFSSVKDINNVSEPQSTFLIATLILMVLYIRNYK